MYENIRHYMGQAYTHVWASPGALHHSRLRTATPEQRAHKPGADTSTSFICISLPLMSMMYGLDAPTCSKLTYLS